MTGELIRFRLWALLGLALVLAGCVPNASSAATAGPAATASPTRPAASTPALVSPAPLATLTPIPVATTPLPSASASPTPARPAFTATATVPSCLGRGGRIERSQLETTLLPTPLEFRVYLPPCYDEQLDLAYPVLYLIHGQSFNDDQWERLGVGTTADALIAAGELPPFLIVMPRDRIWQEPTHDHFGRAVAEVLLPWIDEHYRTLAFPAYRAVGGLSRGGAWALHLGLGYWPLFGSVGLHSGFVFQSDVNSGDARRWLSSIPTDQMPRLYIDLGDNDRPEIAQSAAWLERLLTEYGIVHEWHMFSGYHNEAYWGKHVEDYLRWYAAPWK